MNINEYCGELTKEDQELLESYQYYKDHLIVQGDKDHNLIGQFTLAEIIRLSKIIKDDNK